MRNFLAGLSGSSGAYGAAGVVIVLIALGLWVQSGRDAAQTTGQSTVVAPDALTQAPLAKSTEGGADKAALVQDDAKTEPVAEAPFEAEPVQQTVGEVPAEAETSTPAPTFDEVRREADGVTVIAGTAAPGADVQILQNGVEIVRATADRSGKFAALALVPPDGQGHVLSLMQSADGTDVASVDEIILAPLSPQVEAKPAAGEDEIAAVAPESGLPAVASPNGTSTEPEPDGSQSMSAPAETAELPATSDLPAPPAITPPEPPANADQTPVIAPRPEVAIAEVAPPVVSRPPPDAEHSEPSAVAVLKSTADGVELLNTPSPEVMTNVAIDTISYSQVGAVELAGRAQSDTKSVRVYLDNASIVSLPVDPQGRWRGALPDVDEGIYTLRVDEVSADGAVTSRVETPFKREAVDVLVAAAAAEQGAVKAVTVQKGATLWAIARDRYGDGALYVRVFEANTASIRNPDLIYPGQIFDLPD